MKRTCHILTEAKDKTCVQFYFEGDWIHSDMDLADILGWCCDQGLSFQISNGQAQRGLDVSWIDKQYPNCLIFPDEEEALLCLMRFV